MAPPQNTVKSSLQSVWLGTILFLALASYTLSNCVPQVTSVMDGSALLNPITTSASVWNLIDEASVTLSAFIPPALPIQLQVLFDTNGLTLGEAEQLVEVLKYVSSITDVFGSTMSMGSKVAVRFYAESALPGPVLQLGGNSIFSSDWLEIVQSWSISYLMANKVPPVGPIISNRLLELAREIVASWPNSQKSSGTAQVLLIVAPNAFNTSMLQWNPFIDAIKQSHVLPIFYSPRSTADWSAQVSSLWSATFDSPPPIHLGINTVSKTYKNFSLNTTLQFVRSYLLNGSPFISDASSRISLTSENNNSTVRSLFLKATVSPLASPLDAPVTVNVGILGLQPVSIKTQLNAGPIASNAVSVLQNINRTSLNMPVSSNITSITILTRPTEGTLYASNSVVTSSGTAVSPLSLSYQPNTTHGVIDVFTYSLQLPCGSFGPYSYTLNLSLVPLPVTAGNDSITLTEDDVTDKLIDLASLVGNPSPSATITLLTLPTMAGSLRLASTDSHADLSTAYPISDAVFKFALHGPYRGAKTIDIRYLVNNQLGATATGTFSISITNVEHSPIISMISKNSVAKRNYILIRDADNGTVTVTVTHAAPVPLEICLWSGSTKDCQNESAGTYTIVSNRFVPIIISVHNPSGLRTLGPYQYNVTATDSTGRVDIITGQAVGVNIISDILGTLLDGVSDLLNTVPSGTSGIITLNPYTPEEPNECYFAGTPKSATLLHAGSAAAERVTWGWNEANTTAVYMAFDGVSGYDDLFFQCTYLYNGMTYVGPIVRYRIHLPITMPTSPQLALARAPDVSSIFIPVQGLVSEGELQATAISATGGTYQQADGGFQFSALTTFGQLSFKLCSIINSTICSTVLTNTVEQIAALPILQTSSLTLLANLNGAVNQFSIPAPTGISNFAIQSLGLLNTGTLKVNGVTIDASKLGYVWPTLNFTYEFLGDLPVTAEMLSMASFTYVLIENGLPSQPGSIVIIPQPTELLPLLPSVSSVVTSLVSALEATVAAPTTLIPGFRIEIDAFEKKQSQDIYANLAVAAGVPSIAELDLTVQFHVPAVGKLELCTVLDDCSVINSSTIANLTLTYDQTLYFTPPLLSALFEPLELISWTIRLVDPLGRFSDQVITRTLGLANDVLSDTLRLNVLGNTSPALRLQVPGVKAMLLDAGLTPDACGSEVPPSPLVCLNGQFIANETVSLVNSNWTVTVATVEVFRGDLYLDTSAGLTLNYHVGTQGLPFLNVSGDVVLNGTLSIRATRSQLDALIGLKRDISASSDEQVAMEGRTMTNVTTVTLLTEYTYCYQATPAVNPGENGRSTLTITFNFNSGNAICSNLPQDNTNGPTDKVARTTPAVARRNFLIWVTCVSVVGALLALLVVITLIFRFNSTAKRAARPYSIRRIKGQQYRTQPSTSASFELQNGSSDSSLMEPEEIDTPAPTEGAMEQESYRDEYVHNEEHYDDAELSRTEDVAMPRSL